MDCLHQFTVLHDGLRCVAALCARTVKSVRSTQGCAALLMASQELAKASNMQPTDLPSHCELCQRCQCWHPNTDAQLGREVRPAGRCKGVATASPMSLTMSNTSNACKLTVRLDRVWTSDLHECKSLRAKVLYRKEHVLSGYPFATDEIIMTLSDRMCTDWPRNAARAGTSARIE